MACTITSNHFSNLLLLLLLLLLVVVVMTMAMEVSRIGTHSSQL
jgi:hypothetical protein